MLKLGKILPCGHCRKNFDKNLKKVPLTKKALKNRHNFSKWMYKLHEQVNKMLGKKSNLSYNDVRVRYEMFRARCLDDGKGTKKKKRPKPKREKTRKEIKKKERFTNTKI